MSSRPTYSPNRPWFTDEIQFGQGSQAAEFPCPHSPLGVGLTTTPVQVESQIVPSFTQSSGAVTYQVSPIALMRTLHLGVPTDYHVQDTVAASTISPAIFDQFCADGNMPQITSALATNNSNVTTHWPRGPKRGPFQDVNLRRQTAATRKIGSCIRCRMQRIRVTIPKENPPPCETAVAQSTQL